MMALFVKLLSLKNINKLTNSTITKYRTFVKCPVNVSLLVGPRSVQKCNKPLFDLPKRTYIKFFRRRLNPETLKINDKIPNEYELIYRNTMDRYILFAQVFSSVCAAIIFMIVIIKEDLGDAIMHMDGWRTQPRATENEIFVYMGAFIFVCVILQLMVSKLPVRIYNLPQRKEYVFVFYGATPFSKKKLMCNIKEVVKLEESGILPWKDCRYEIKDQRNIIMVDNFFRTPADLNIMLGYQDLK